MSGLILLMIVVVVVAALVVLARFVLRLREGEAQHTFREETQRTLREETQRALREFAKQVLEAAEQSRELLGVMDVPGRVSVAKNRIDGIVNEHISKLPNRIESFVGDEVYFAAFKSILPGSRWRAEYEELMNRKFVELVNQAGLSEEIDVVFKETFESLAEPLRLIKVRKLSPPAEAALSYLSSHPERLDSLLEKNDPLRKVVEAQLSWKQIALGETLTIGGLITYELLEKEGVKRATEAGLKVLTFMQPELLAKLYELVATEIRDWLIAHVGEEALKETLQWFAIAVVPVLGQIVAVWRTLKYSRLVYRLLIVKEPLQRLKEKLRDECEKCIRKAGEIAKARVEEQAVGFRIEAENYYTTLQATYSGLIPDAAQRAA